MTLIIYNKTLKYNIIYIMLYSKMFTILQLIGILISTDWSTENRVTE